MRKLISIRKIMTMLRLCIIKKNYGNSICMNPAIYNMQLRSSQTYKKTTNHLVPIHPIVSHHVYSDSPPPAVPPPIATDRGRGSEAVPSRGPLISHRPPVAGHLRGPGPGASGDDLGPQGPPVRPPRRAGQSVGPAEPCAVHTL